MFCTATTDAKNYYVRQYYFYSDTAVGVTMTYIQDNSAVPVVSGNLTLSQGVYYATIMGVGFRSNYDPTLFECPNDDKWLSYNTHTSPALRRF